MKREAAEARVVAVARRSAFVSAAAGQVADPEAAYKLAVADGMLDDLDLDEDGNAKDPKAAGKIVEALTKTYSFLAAPNNRSFGEPKNGQPPGPPADLSKLSSRQLLELGYSTGSGARTRS